MTRGKKASRGAGVRESTYILPVGERPVFVTKKAIKNMYIRVGKDLAVRVSAPLRARDADIAAFVEQHEAWIERAAAQQRQRKAREEEDAKSGKVMLWGEEYLLSDPSMRGKAIEDLYRAQLAAALPAWTAHCESLVGKHASAWKIRKMRSRWGSCQPRTGEIHLSLYLAAYPKECLEYVMVHELVHLYVADHGPRFKAYMDRFLPDWRKRRKRLQNEGVI